MIDVDTCPSRARALLSRLRGPLLLALTYYLGAEAAFLIGTLSDKIFAPFWPPNAILFCALALLPYQRWPLYILAALPAHVMAELSVGMAWLQTSVAFATNVVVAALNAFAMRSLLGMPPWFDSLHKTILYVLITAVTSAFAALGGAFVRITGGGNLGGYWLFWAQWYIANALASLTLAALLLTWLAKKGNWEEFGSRARRAEAAVLLLGLGIACVVGFKEPSFAKPCYVPVFVNLPLPFVIWAAVRFRTIGASVSILIVTVLSISSVLNGETVFASETVEASVLSLQLFLMVVSGSALLLGASVDELRQAEQVTAKLARSVIGVHDQERRHVARRLLDDVAQRLAAASWVADRIEPDEAVRQSILDLRKLSYLLHPPMLEEAGLVAALRGRLNQYTQCTGIKISFHASWLGRLPADLELTIFRIVEEALTNIKRHSGSSTARVSIERELQSRDEAVMVSIEDSGGGMPWMTDVLVPAIQRLTSTTTGWGLGLARMRERVRRLGGSLEISSANNKTTVSARFPLRSA